MKINNPKQSLYKKIDIGAIYKDCLLQHKEFIKTNKFAKETEEKYHKVAHKPYKPTPILSFEKKLPQIHQWPIDSEQFNNALKLKLEISFTPSYMPKRSISFNRHRRSPKSTRERLKTGYDHYVMSDLSDEKSLTIRIQKFSPREGSRIRRNSMDEGLRYME